MEGTHCRAGSGIAYREYRAEVRSEGDRPTPASGAADALRTVEAEVQPGSGFLRNCAGYRLCHLLFTRALESAGEGNGVYLSGFLGDRARNHPTPYDRDPTLQAFSDTETPPPTPGRDRMRGCGRRVRPTKGPFATYLLYTHPFPPLSMIKSGISALFCKC